ncbi:hypothetical protein V8G54_018282 [Vigna mungo]|uniref:Endonuclease/exonuclease/phosphatase domain-containing protein n=1 Tax=Vigna mungo TaxID=3915 RepID=A0AAQ3RUL1_VIGMU
MVFVVQVSDEEKWRDSDDEAAMAEHSESAFEMGEEQKPRPRHRQGNRSQSGLSSQRRYQSLFHCLPHGEIRRRLAEAPRPHPDDDNNSLVKNDELRSEESGEEEVETSDELYEGDSSDDLCEGEAIYKVTSFCGFSGFIGCGVIVGAIVKKYEVEFNKAAQSLTDAVIPTTQKKTALNRLVKASTHVNVHQDLKDVKLWQVHTLLKGLEKIAANANIPMLVCGDFNSVSGRSAYFLGLLLLSTICFLKLYSYFSVVLLMHFLQWEDPSHPDLAVDPLNILLDSLLELLDEESLRKDRALPSPEWSSDHIALLAKFRCCRNRSRR